jgi:hypothetical protein
MDDARVKGSARENVQLKSKRNFLCMLWRYMVVQWHDMELMGDMPSFNTTSRNTTYIKSASKEWNHIG